MDIIQIGKDAARTLWAHKSLWFFGFFVATAGGGVSVNLDGGEAAPEWLIPALAAALVVGIGMVVMHVISEGALIDGVRRVRAGGAHGIRQGVATGWAHFGRVLGVKAIVAMGTTLTIAAAIGPVLAGLFELLPLAAGVAGTVALGVVAVPIVLTLTLVGQYALRFVVMEGRPVSDALRKARRMLHGRLQDSLMLLVTAAVGRAGLSAVVALPTAAVGGLLGLGTYALFGAVPAGVVAALVVVPMAVLLAGAVGTWSSSIWTLGFIEVRR